MGLHFIGSGFAFHHSGEGAKEGVRVALAHDAGPVVAARKADPAAF
jgi:hypothetical protein